MTIPTREDDEFLLSALDLRAHEGLGFGNIAKRIGRTRSAVGGLLTRFDKAEQPPCQCVKPENMDGGMPRGWWRS